MDHLILAITVFLKDKKLHKKVINLLIFKIEDDALMAMNSIDILKDIFDRFNKPYTEKGWGSKQLIWELLRHFYCENYPPIIDYIIRFCLVVQRLRNFGQDLNNNSLVFE